MIGKRLLLSRNPGSPAYVWPITGTDTPDEIFSNFGPRPFSFHIATVGYDYDFHRGCDIAAPSDAGTVEEFARGRREANLDGFRPANP